MIPASVPPTSVQVASITPEQAVLARSARQEELVQQALAANFGSRDWREWKRFEVAALNDLFHKAPRMELLELDLTGDLHATYRVRMPVPRPPCNGRLVVATWACFHLRYAQEWRTEAPQGWATLELWLPGDPFHPNCRPFPGRPLGFGAAICLGRLLPGVRPVEICHLGYHTLTLQACILDETDVNGVLNMAACEYFRQHPEYLPLTPAGLLDPWEGDNDHA